MNPYALLRPFLFGLDPERAHALSISVLKSRLLPNPPPSDPRLAQKLIGLDFRNPIGLAAGYDKNGEVMDAARDIGFGFVEVGTVTPRPQAGNARPRLFRLEREGAIINRLGFNNDGFEAVRARMLGRAVGAPVGINIGANRDSTDRVADYVAGVARFIDLADYVAINVSSPNTPGLRDLQEAVALDDLLARVAEARAGVKGAEAVPLLVKLAPDIGELTLGAAIDKATTHGIDGLIIGNTTLSREGLRDPRGQEEGGLSGRPLHRRSTILLAQARRIAGRALVLIGAGGVDSPDTAFDKLAAGADLVQLYTGMVFEGPGLPERLAAGLAERLDRAGAASVAEIVGRETARWASLAPQAS